MELANQFEAEMPDISEIIRTSFYVDDFVCGSDSIENGSFICENVSKVLDSGCFPLRKWLSNEPRILENIAHKSEDKFNILEFGKEEEVKDLGLTWSCASDSLTFKISNPPMEKVTKRLVLSHIGKLWDPFGILSPCIVIAKMIMQRLWMIKSSWDESLPEELYTQWIRFYSELSCFNDLLVPRHVVCVNAVSYELHGFSDASENAYGGAIYIRSVDSNGKIMVRLLCAKTKVAPLKTMTVPRLELQGSLVLARLASKVFASLKLKFDHCVFWTDSSIVLGWLKSEPSSLKTFVSNRVAEIQQITLSHEWRHVPTGYNPSDVLSRGVYPSQILNLDLWWSGPKWLMEPENSWPKSSHIESITIPDVKVVPRQTSLVSCEFDSFLFSKYSNYTKLKRVTAWVLRYKSNCLGSKKNKTIGSLSTKELEAADQCLVRISQRICFPEDYGRLERGLELSPKSKILNLNPFTVNGVIRVGGRLRNSNFTFNKKHPMLVSPKHLICKMIFDTEHLRLLHAGPQMLLSSIRQKYWPTLGRNFARVIVRKCVKCRRYNPATVQPIMGDLPKSRLTGGYAFNIVGVDYLGPLQILNKKGRGAKLSKCYVSLFVCFATKAIHLEPVYSLDTESFLATFRRFVARRGRPSHVYSGNGSNFVGANNELQQLGNFLNNNKTKIVESVSRENIQWHFIPAQSPHFGGLWEAGVRSAKHHLKLVAGFAHLNFEELCTLLAQIESVLNSRPLFPLSSDPSDLEPLTPAHFLVGRSLVELPDPELNHIPENRLSRYQRVQQIKQHFWTRWHREYVHELQQRTKWQRNHSDLKEGAMVLIKEDNSPPSRWKLGRVMSVIPGKDNLNRVANLKTIDGIVKRSFSKICPLPVKDEKS